MSIPYIAPKFSARHKLQKLEKQPTPSDIWDCFVIVGRNQIISSIFHAVMIVIRGRQPIYRFEAVLPGMAELFRDVALAAFFHDILFYYIHRLIHHPSLYPSIHKLHHRFTVPISLAAQYATSTEHLLSNLIPVVMPLMILKAHVVTFWVVLALGLFQITTVHSGFNFFAGRAMLHDFHHEKFVVNFGSAGLLDRLHGTRYFPPRSGPVADS